MKKAEPWGILPTEWIPLTMWQRFVYCPSAGCDYMAIEERRHLDGPISGVCTKCGHAWWTKPGDGDE